MTVFLSLFLSNPSSEMALILTSAVPAISTRRATISETAFRKLASADHQGTPMPDQRP